MNTIHGFFKECETHIIYTDVLNAHSAYYSVKEAQIILNFEMVLHVKIKIIKHTFLFRRSVDSLCEFL